MTNMQSAEIADAKRARFTVYVVDDEGEPIEAWGADTKRAADRRYRDMIDLYDGNRGLPLSRG